MKSRRVNRMIRLQLAVVTVLTAGFIGGCAGPAPSPTEAPTEASQPEEAATEAPTEAPTEAAEEAEVDKVFKLGVLGPFSGPTARIGQELQKGIELAFEDIEYQIGDYEIELVLIDSQADPAKGAEAYEEAIVQKGIQAAMMNWHSSVAVACMDIAAKHQIPHFFGLGAATTLNEMWEAEPDKYFYWLKGWPDPPKLGKNYVLTLNDAVDSGMWEPEAKTVAVWGEQTDWGRTFGEGVAQQFEELGWEVIAMEYFPLDQTEFTPLLTKWKNENPAVCIGTGSTPAMYASIVKQADQVDLGCVMVADGLGFIGEWYDMSGESSDYVIDQIPGFVTEEAQAYAEEFEEKTGLEPSPSAAGISHDYANFFIRIAQQVYEETGELNSETIAEFSREKVQTGEFTYTDGLIMPEYKFSADSVPDPVVGLDAFTFPVLQYFDGEGKVVYPPAWAEQDLIPQRAGGGD